MRAEPGRSVITACGRRRICPSPAARSIRSSPNAADAPGARSRAPGGWRRGSKTDYSIDGRLQKTLVRFLGWVPHTRPSRSSSNDKSVRGARLRTAWTGILRLRHHTLDRRVCQLPAPAPTSARRTPPTYRRQARQEGGACDTGARGAGGAPPTAVRRRAQPSTSVSTARTGNPLRAEPRERGLYRLSSLLCPRMMARSARMTVLSSPLAPH